MTESNVKGWCVRFRRDTKAQGAILLGIDQKGCAFLSASGQDDHAQKIADDLMNDLLLALQKRSKEKREADEAAQKMAKELRKKLADKVKKDEPSLKELSETSNAAGRRKKALKRVLCWINPLLH